MQGVFILHHWTYTRVTLRVPVSWGTNGQNLHPRFLAPLVQLWSIISTLERNS